MACGVLMVAGMVVVSVVVVEEDLVVVVVVDMVVVVVASTPRDRAEAGSTAVDPVAGSLPGTA
jgi:hypothetical protein